MNRKELVELFVMMRATLVLSIVNENPVPRALANLLVFQDMPAYQSNE